MEKVFFNVVVDMSFLMKPLLIKLYLHNPAEQCAMRSCQIIYYE